MINKFSGILSFMLPTFAFMVDGMLEESLAQLSKMREVVNKPHVLDDATLNRVLDLYDKQLDDQRYFVEQFSSWKQGSEQCRSQGS